MRVARLNAFRRSVGYDRKAVRIAVNQGGHRLLRRHCMQVELSWLGEEFGRGASDMDT
jgi:hypothetical protein